MIAALAVAWVLIGVLSVPWLIGWMNRHGDGLIRDPAMEVFIGAVFGPVPLFMFGCYFVLRTIGRAVFRLTGQHGEVKAP